MISLVSENDCCLCKACENACPSGAISFTREINSFLYPVIEAAKCINCNKCNRVCPARNITEQKALNRAFVSYSKDSINRKNSSSGGIFFECAKKIIDEGGYVCGAIWDNDFSVKHILSNDISDISKMRGSKYLQSDLRDVYKEIEHLLRAGNKVLFCGCPCQVNSLHSYLNHEYATLVTLDFVCHGVPSKTAFREYKNILETKYRSKVKKVSFRDKSKGWHSSSVKIEFENGKKYHNPITVDPYMRAFLSGTMLKESCYSCKYKHGFSKSDITLADFWGAEVLFPDIDDNKGLSAVIVNTDKGIQYISLLNIICYETDIESVIKYNKNLMEPTLRSDNRNQFLMESVNKNYGEAIISLFSETLLDKVKRKGRYALRCVYYRLTGRGTPLY